MQPAVQQVVQLAVQLAVSPLPLRFLHVRPLRRCRGIQLKTRQKAGIEMVDLPMVGLVPVHLRKRPRKFVTSAAHITLTLPGLLRESPASRELEGHIDD